MFANGPQCIRHGWPSSVWIRFGLSASLRSTAIAPAAPRSSAVTGSAAVERVRDGDAAEPPAQVLQVARDGHDRHHLARRRDVEPALARVAVRAAAEPDRDPAQRPVVHVDGAPPVDPQLVDVVRVAVQDRRVEHRGQQVVRGPDRVDVAGEVEVEVLHRHDLRHPAAGRAALDAEHRSERRLAQARDRPLADRAEPLREADQRRRLALPRLRRRHARHADQLAVRPSGEPLGDREVDLGLVPAVRLELLGLETESACDLLDRPQDRVLRDLEAALHPLLLLLLYSARDAQS